MTTKNFPRPLSKDSVANCLSTFSNPLAQSPPITLIRPSILFSGASYSTPIGLPIGLAYLTAVLKRANYRVNPIDCVGLGINQVQETPDKRFKIRGISIPATLNRIDPTTDIIGITIMFSQEWPYIKKVIKKISQRFPKATILLGGEHATATAEFSLRDCPEVDCIIRGEGELTLLKICHALRTNGDFREIEGIAYLEEDRFINKELSPRIGEVGNIPWPAWDEIDLEPYFQPAFTMGISHGRNMALIATRGCPYQCTFCSSPTMWTTRYGMRPPSDVVDEIESYKRKYDINSVDFYDLTAIVRKDWILEFASELKRRNLNLRWQLPSGTRSEVLDKEVLSAVSTAGLEFLVYAPESGSPRILKQIKKQVSLDKMLESIRIAISYRIIVKVNFIIGFPEEYRSDIFQTLKLVWKLALMNVDDCNISNFSPYPGSELFEELQKENRIAKLDDQYFESLMMQFNLASNKTFCRNVGAKEITFYRILGMSIFYALSYLRKPSRVLRLIKLVLSGGSFFQAKSLFEQRMLDFIVRSKLAMHSPQVC